MPGNKSTHWFKELIALLNAVYDRTPKRWISTYSTLSHVCCSGPM
jgi:hypothetical protein